jgi:hypothetical protein
MVYFTHIYAVNRIQYNIDSMRIYKILPIKCMALGFKHFPYNIVFLYSVAWVCSLLHLLPSLCFTG